MPETLEIPLNDVNKWLEKETASIIEPLRADAKKLLEDIKEKLADLLEACDKLLDDAEKEMDKGSRKTYRRAKSLFKLAENFSGLIEKIVIPQEINGKTLEETSEQLKKNLKSIGQEKTKWFRAISPYFIMSRRRFDVTFKRAEDSFQNFATFLSEKYTRASHAESLPYKVEELRQSLDELKKFEKAVDARKKKKEHLKKEIANGYQKMESIQSKDEVVELTQLNLRIGELKKLANRELRHIQKPLLKFQSLINSPGYNLFPDAASKLEEYMTCPFEALATEEAGYPLLKTILQKIDTALDNKKMKLKSSRLRKAKEQIESIVNDDALLSLQGDCIKVLSKKHALSNSGTISECRDERARVNERLEDLQRKKNLLEARDARFKKDHDEVRERINEQKQLLENIVSEFYDKKFKILTG